jgi:hypothetical protein
MRVLPNNRWRAFVEFYVLGVAKGGPNAAAAARAARFGKPGSTALRMAHLAWKLMRDDRIIAAIAEESRKLLRSGAPEAVRALQEIVRNPEHKDHVRGISMVLDRADPVTTISQAHVDVTHRIVDPDQEALEELRALRALGTTREKLIELFGGNGLARIEKLEAKRADHARVIEGVVVDNG